MERNPGNVKKESEEISKRSNDSSNSQQHSSLSCLVQQESEDQEDGNRHESVQQEETSTRRKRDEISSTDNNNNDMNDENDERECSICGHSIPVMNFDIHFSNCQRRHSQTSRNMITSSGNTRSNRRTNGTTVSSNSHAPARTTLNVRSNLYNDSLQCNEEEENNDERKPAARPNMPESGETNDQAIHIDDSMENDDTPDSPPRQRPRYINHSMNTRSRTTRNSSAGQRITEPRQTSSSDDDCIDIATLPNYNIEMSIDEVINLASPPTHTTTTSTTARTRSFASRTSDQELIDLTSSPEKPLADNQTEQDQNNEWACPRCTLLNAQTDRRCDACNLPRPDAPNDNDSPDGNLRSPDASFRDRLIDPTSSSASIRLTTRDHARSQALLNEFLNHLSPQQPPRPPRRGLMDSVGQHAILGSAVGAVSAIGGMGGGRSSNVLGSTLQGAVAGAVGGAISHGIARISSSNNSSSSSRRNSDTSRTTRSASRNRNDTDIDHDAPSEPNRPELPESLRRLGRSYRTFNGPGFRVVMMDGSLPQDQVQQLQAQGMGVHLVRLQQGTHPVDGMNYERLLELFGDGSENRSTDPEVIRSLPSSTIVDVEKEVPKDRRQCCICLDEFENGQNRKTLQCLHGFHEECIDKWLKGSRNCPICKFDVQGSA